MTTLMAIDPGMMSGYFYGEFDELTPLMRIGYKQIPGGSKGLFDFLQGRIADVVVCEKFTPRPNGGRQFRLDEFEPIRIEGWMEVFYPNVAWQKPAAMVLRNGATQTERKRSSDNVLRETGWWLTGSDPNVNYKDANDVNAAAKHALAYIRSIGHEPTISVMTARA